jgi:hypothetical protein
MPSRFTEPTIVLPPLLSAALAALPEVIFSPCWNVRENGSVVPHGNNALNIAVEPSEITSDDDTVVAAENELVTPKTLLLKPVTLGAAFVAVAVPPVRWR